MNEMPVIGQGGPYRTPYRATKKGLFLSKSAQALLSPGLCSNAALVLQLRMIPAASCSSPLFSFRDSSSRSLSIMAVLLITPSSLSDFPD
jgi:hypothetical protein